MTILYFESETETARVETRTPEATVRYMAQYGFRQITRKQYKAARSNTATLLPNIQEVKNKTWTVLDGLE